MVFQILVQEADLETSVVERDTYQRYPQLHAFPQQVPA